MLQAIQNVILDRAFNMVEDKEHWKNPIDKSIWVREEDVEVGSVILRSITFFTATHGTCWVADRNEERKLIKLHFTAPGYWAGPAN